MKSTRCICRTVAVLVVLVGTTAMVSAQERGLATDRF